MIKDPDNSYIAAILSAIDLAGKDVLEIGCGDGRITNELGAHARRVVAVDPDATILERARLTVRNPRVEFAPAPPQVSHGPGSGFDLVIYTLSLHHIPPHRMLSNLEQTTGLLRDGGVLAVLEPGKGGSFTELKERFGAGSGDERPQKEAALEALANLQGWRERKRVMFRTGFLFRDHEDFLKNMLPEHGEWSQELGSAVRQFLEKFRTPRGTLLEADRVLMILTQQA